MVEGDDGVLEGPYRPVVDLLEVRLGVAAQRRRKQRGVDVERHGPLRKAQGVQPRVGLVHELLDLRSHRTQIGQLLDAGAVGLADALPGCIVEYRGHRDVNGAYRLFW